MAANKNLPLDYEIVVYAGTSYRREFRWRPDGTTLQDFTGWSASMLLGQPLGVADIELSTDNGGITLSPTGQIIIAMTPAQTLTLKPPVTYYNLDLTDSGGFVRRFLRGRVSVVVDVKKRPPPP